MDANLLTAKPDDSKDDEEEPEYMRGRATVDNELEDVIDCKPFTLVDLYTGQKNAARFFGSPYTKVGTWKGLVRVSETKEPSDYESHVKDLLHPRSLMCRLYVLRATKLMPKDTNGKADPYLTVTLGKTKISTRDRHFRRVLDAPFYEAFEIPVSLPGDSTLKLQVWDWDGIGDDLIGTTYIDIEDRWFSKAWRKLMLKPVEIRTLRSTTSTASQGKVALWVELLTAEDSKKFPMINIKPPPPEEYECRVIVWGCRDVTIKDTITNQNDLFITCQPSINTIKKQSTDTHLRSKKGLGNFNWRMKFPFMLPIKPWPRLRFQIWDLDFFSPNDFICESVISLKGLCRQALKKKDAVKIMVKGKDRFWLEDLRNPGEGEKNQGRMEISVELMPAAMAAQLPAGFGRSDPNQNPFLPEPAGRVKWSIFHPFDMLRELLGDRLCRKICCAFLLLTLISAISFVAPLVFSNLISKYVFRT